MQKSVFLLDGYGLIYRNYFAMMNNPLRNADGQNISAINGFFSTLLNLCKQYQPQNLIVVLDPKGKTFRSDIYPEYKAHRDKTPEDLHSQIDQIKELLNDLNIRSLTVENYEADDAMGSYARLAQQHGYYTYLVSNDKDLLQLVDEKTGALKLNAGQFTLHTPAEVEQAYEIKSTQIIDYLAILGDSADNIPGIKGIGKKSAQKLLQSHEGLDEIYEHIAEYTPAMQKKLLEGKEAAYLSQKLATICLDIPLELDEAANNLQTVHFDVAIPKLHQWGLYRIAESLQNYFHKNYHTPLAQTTATASDDSYNQGDDLFSDLPEQRTVDYDKIITKEQALEWFALIKKQGIVAFDCETDNINPMLANACGFSFAIAKNKAAYLPLRAGGQSYLDEEWVIAQLKALLEDPKIKIIGQNFKYDMKVLRHLGIRVRCWFDTMIAAWLINSSGRHNMDYLAKTYLNYIPISFSKIVPKGQIFEDIDLETAVPYAAEDADITWQLYELFYPKLQEKALLDLLHKIDIPLINVLADVEYTGIHLEAEKLSALQHEFAPQIDALEKTIHTLLGETINLSSPKQLQKALFEDGPFEGLKKTQTGFSTDNSVLEQLTRQYPENPIPALLIQYRVLTKLMATYIIALPKEINPRTKRIHTSFFVTGTVTGRLASSDPNLQNIPIKDSNGKRIREAFTAPKGYKLLSADYSQIELVVLAHLSKDPGLKAAFSQQEDIHTRTASRIFKIDKKEVDAKQRNIAKTINFGVIYGMSAFRLANELQISRADAKSFIDSYFEEFSQVQSYMDATLEQARKDTFVKTLLGHTRHLDYINSANKVERSSAERMAVNTCIQGSAADIVKVAMLCLNKKIAQQGLDAKLLLQVHDEFVLEFAEEQEEAVCALVKQEMENAVKLSVPLAVSISTGYNWGEIH